MEIYDDPVRHTADLLQRCGDCRYHRKDGREWVCQNPEADGFGLEKDYNNGNACADFERRPKKAWN